MKFKMSLLRVDGSSGSSNSSSSSSMFYSTTIKVHKNNAYHNIRPKKGNSDRTLTVKACNIQPYDEFKN